MTIDIVNPKEFLEGSFADEKIIESNCDLDKKVIIFKFKEVEYYNDVVLHIRDWWDFKIKMNDVNEEIYIPIEKFEPLDEILIFSLNDKELILEGFGQDSLQWLKFIFIKPKVSISGARKHD